MPWPLCLELGSCPGLCCRLFDASPQMLAMGIQAMRIISLSFIFAGFCIVMASFFQTLGNGMISLVTAVARQLVVLIPVALILSHFIGMTGVWWAFPIAEIASVSFSALYFLKIYREKFKHCPQGKTE